MRKNIIITGKPEVGKSTTLKKLLEFLTKTRNERVLGLVTREMRDERIRKGFVMSIYGVAESSETLQVIAHVDRESDIKVGNKYGVNKYGVDVLSEMTLDLIRKPISGLPTPTMFCVDEIAEMQLCSEKFRELGNTVLNSGLPVILTMSAAYEHPYMHLVKNRADVITVELTIENRDEQLEYLKQLTEKIRKAYAYASQPKRFSVLSPGIVSLVSDSDSTRTINLATRECDCAFFHQHGVCSHLLAAEDIFKK